MQTIYDEAIRCYQQCKYDEAIKLFSHLNNNDEITYNIATCHKDKKTHDDLLTSINMFEKLLSKKLKDAELRNRVIINYVSAITLMCKLHIDHAQYDRSITLVKNALRHIPNEHVLVYNLGHMYKCIGNYDLAIKYLECAIALDNTHQDTYVELINIYRDLHDHNKQLDYINKGINNVKNNAMFYNDLGLLLSDNDTKAANEAFNLAISKTDDKVSLCKIRTNMGHMLANSGYVKEALSQYEMAMNLCPTDLKPLQNYLMDLLYLDDMDYKAVLRNHFNLGCFIQTLSHTINANVRNTGNKIIHLGYVSSDFFGSHPITYFVYQLLNSFNPNSFKVFCYSMAPLTGTDKYSNKITWRNIKYLQTDSCVQLILSDRIDILVDLSGHTAGSRMDIFANRLAKIQLSYLGYPCITGIPDIDYYIIDETFKFTSSKTICMPHCFTHYEVGSIPNKLITPMYQNGFITFSSLNKPSKINNSVVKLWNSVLLRYPESHLHIKHIQNANFTDMSRVIFLPLVKDLSDYINQYNNIDIALDTFPYAGTTTTCESLLMGTPVITLADRKTHRIHQNTTASILINSDLGFLVATNEDEFMNIVDKTVNDMKNNPDYKLMIQKKFLSGYVTNAKQYMSDYETLLMSLMSNYLATHIAL